MILAAHQDANAIPWGDLAALGAIFLVLVAVVALVTWRW